MKTMPKLDSGSGRENSEHWLEDYHTSVLLDLCVDLVLMPENVVVLLASRRDPTHRLANINRVNRYLRRVSVTKEAEIAWTLYVNRRNLFFTASDMSPIDWREYMFSILNINMEQRISSGVTPTFQKSLRQVFVHYCDDNESVNFQHLVCNKTNWSLVKELFAMIVKGETE